MIVAGLENQTGDPGRYRDYSLVKVMDEDSSRAAELRDPNHAGLELTGGLRA
jgi:hypothetical protein